MKLYHIFTNAAVLKLRVESLKVVVGEYSAVVGGSSVVYAFLVLHMQTEHFVLLGAVDSCGSSQFFVFFVMAAVSEQQ